MNRFNFDYIVGSGGIGKGILFKLQGDHTLGRSESRLGQLTNYKDYCKLHIILHYAAVFLEGKIPVYAIGRVGCDKEGQQLKQDMSAVGIDVSCVEEDEESPTMYAVCYQYPTGEGGNITTVNSASSHVTQKDIDRFFRMKAPKGKGIVLAAPEVPLEARLRLLEHGRRKNCLNVAAVLSGEVKSFVQLGGVKKTDILSLNLDEAAAFAALNPQADSDVIVGCVAFLQRINPEISVVVTQGAKGAMVCHGLCKYLSPPIDVSVTSTAGAGDCLIGTIMAALVMGIPLIPFEKTKDAMASALDIGSAASSKKVTCADTIDSSLNRNTLAAFAQQHALNFSSEIMQKFFQVSTN
ncbi:MAG: PfkB family carbohydrate kinase [Ruthenibacterium sp.]